MCVDWGATVCIPDAGCKTLQCFILFRSKSTQLLSVLLTFLRIAATLFDLMRRLHGQITEHTDAK